MKKTKRRNNFRKIALFLTMVLTMTQIATVPVIAEEFTGNTVQEQDVFQDGSDAIMESIEDVDVMMESSEETTMELVQEPELFQDSEEEAAVELFSAGDTAVAMSELTSGETAAEKNIQYRVSYEYINSSGDGVMLPNSQMKIQTILFDCTNDDNWKEIPGYTIEIQPLAEGYVGKIEVSADDSNIVINSHNETGWFEFQANFLSNEKVIHTHRFTFSVNEYKLTPQTIVDENGNKLNPKVGESIDLSKVGFELQEYRDGKLYPVEDSSKFKIGIDEGTWENGEKWYDYDTEGWTLKNVSGQDLPIMTRTTENGTWFALTVRKQVTEDNWELIARIHFPFDSLSNYEGGGEDGDIWHDGSSEELSDYTLGFDYLDTIGNGAMLPNSQMTIVTDLRDKNNNYSEITDYKLEIITQSKFGEATVVDNGKNLLIESKDKIGSGNCYVSVQIPDGNGSYQEIFKRDIGFSVSKYMLTPQTIVDENGNKLNPEVGESIDLSKVGFQLKEYKDGALYPVENTSNFKIEVSMGTENGETWYDYDTEGWRLETVSGQDLPIMTRITEGSTWFGVTVMEKNSADNWNQIARCQYFFEPLSDDGDGKEEEEEGRYRLWYDFVDTTGNGAMLPNSQMTINTQLYDCIDDDNWEEVTGYTLEISPTRSDYTRKADISLNDNNIVINSHNEIGDVSFYAKVLLNGEEVLTKKIWFEISEYVIFPTDITDADGNVINPEVGAEVDIVHDMKPYLAKYIDGAFVPVTGDNYKIVISQWTDENGETNYDYDADGWVWKDVEGQELPILERSSGYGTNFALTAMQKESDGNWSQIARREYHVDELSGYGDEDNSGNRVELWPQSLEVNPKVGESINLAEKNIGLVEYRDGVPYEVGDPDLKIIVCGVNDEETGEWLEAYDTKGWTMKKVSGQDLPIMTRITEDATWFAVCAIQKDEDGNSHLVARNVYSFDAVPHTHSWKKGKVTKKATCTSDGIRKDTCACGKTKKVTIPAKGHTEVKDAAVAATVFAKGKTEGSHCSVCGTVIKKQKSVAKLTPTISLTASSLKMQTGQSTTAFKASKLAKGDYVKKVVSANTGIVKVTNVKKSGTFKLTAGKKTGSTTVTVSLASGKTASFKVTVQKSAVKTTKITTSTKTLTLKKGDSYKKLASSITVAPVTSKEKITYSSSDRKVATVTSEGVIKAKKVGTTKITVKSGSKSVVVTVKVTGIKTTKLSGVPSTKTLTKGKSFTIKAVASPSNTDDTIIYKSSNTKVATVTEKGVVKGVSKGTATITVQSGSKKLTCKITVK